MASSVDFNGVKFDAGLGCAKPECGGLGLIAVGRQKVVLSDEQFAELRSGAARLRVGSPIPTDLIPGQKDKGAKDFILTKPAIIGSNRVIIEVAGHFPIGSRSGQVIIQAEIDRRQVHFLATGGETLERARAVRGFSRYLDLPRLPAS